MRINEAPAIEVHLVRNGEERGGSRRTGRFDAAPALAERALCGDGRTAAQLPSMASNCRKRKPREGPCYPALGDCGFVVAGLSLIGWMVFAPGPTTSRADPGRAQAPFQRGRSIRRFRHPEGGQSRRPRTLPRPRRRLRGLSHEDRRQPFAGGRAFVLPFGTICRPTSRPTRKPVLADTATRTFWRPSTGSQARRGAAFPHAVRQLHLSYRRRCADNQGLFVQPQADRRAWIPNTFAFSFDQRSAMGIWAVMLMPTAVSSRIRPQGGVERSAYLVEALAIAADAMRRAICFRHWTIGADSPAPHRRMAPPTTSQSNIDERRRRIDPKRR